MSDEIAQEPPMPRESTEEFTLDSNQELTPESTQESTPESTQESIPESAQKSIPESTPESTQESTPESTEESTPESTAESAVESPPEQPSDSPPADSTGTQDNPPEKKEENGLKTETKVEAGIIKPQNPLLPKEAVIKDDWIDIFGTGELKMKTVRKGKRNTKPQPSDMCDVRLIGKLENGKLVEKYDLHRVQIGDHEVVQGLELILPLMNVGEKALVIIAPRFGYGVYGNPPNVPPNSTLKYVIELFNVEIQTPLENIPHDERMTLATAKRERGNWWYSRQDTTKAVQCYKKAADLLDETISYVDPKGRIIENTRAKKRIVVQEKIKVYNNLAAAQLKLDAYDSALDSVLVVLQHEPNNVKALFRKAKILSAKGRVSEAIVPLRQACLLEPRNTAVLSEINRCMRILEIERRDERILCRKMFGHSDHSDEENVPMQELMPTEEKNLIWQKLLKTAVTATIMAAVAAALGYKFKNYPFL